MIKDLSKNNPWRAYWMCPKKTCPPCQEYAILAAEKEQEALRMVCTNGTEGKGDMVNRCLKEEEDTQTLPECNGEGVNYVMECFLCRKQGI